MNIIKRLTAMTSLTVCLGVLTPTTIVFAKTNSTNDNHIMKSNDSEQSHAIGFAANASGSQSDNQEINIIFGNSLLQQGDSGPEVAKLQNELRQLGYYGGEVDGVFGEQTYDAVHALESDRQDSESGIVGSDTKTALYTIYRNTDESKQNQKKLVEIKIQEKKNAKERARKAAEEKAKKIAEEAARQAAKEDAKKAAAKKAVAERANASAEKRPQVTTTSYKPSNSQPAATASKGKSITVEATSYSLGGHSATGIDFSSNPNAKVIAVDPSIIPLGSRVIIPGYGVYIAGDTGGAIRGNRIDVHFASRDQALNFGRRTITITVLQ
ncbi:3D domain-containing protein [Sporolactobacillus shoreicorticis]|uniref:3D domain-containing protein n=1 Tax=Sporolactobacillus shoreicorticis TaxID=1923877 RepID=A0ABW5S7L0_9BACL|nr:3D domain-containing protein [Sporolactobacillus shoreicorticis]MCO7126722.1 3D domain-containing protein [Sporolactobacillus shoreicorticis]